MTCWAAAGSPSDPPHSPAAALADFNCTTLYTWQYETAERSILLLTNKFNYHWLFGLCDVFLSSKYSSVCCSCKIIKLSYSFYDSIYYFLCCKTVPHNAKKTPSPEAYTHNRQTPEWRFRGFFFPEGNCVNFWFIQSSGSWVCQLIYWYNMNLRSICIVFVFLWKTRSTFWKWQSVHCSATYLMQRYLGGAEKWEEGCRLHSVFPCCS